LNNATTKAVAFGFAVGALTFAPVAKADDWTKKTVITTHQAIQIQGKLLAPGKYVVKLLDSRADRGILQIFDAGERKLEMTILATPTYRPGPPGDTRFTFSEMQDGQALVLRSWFYAEDNSGLEFFIMR
jgi:hypothetical protein